jgi:FAD/FMN-containing dehydrogenase/Fe-S oxidoreductase
MLEPTETEQKISAQQSNHENDPYHFQTPQAKNVDAIGLEQELNAVIDGEVRFDNGSRALYSTDSSNYRQVPIGVVLPKNQNDIIKTVALCRKYNAPILSRGAGTSLAGQCCNVAVIMDMSKYYNHVLHVDTANQLAKVEPGIVLDHFRLPIQKEHTLTFGPDPATHDHCTIGGMLGNNSCGVHSVMAAFAGNGARTSDNVERLTVLTYDGLKMDVGPTSEEDLEEIISEGGRRGSIYRKLKDLRDTYSDLIRERFPKIPRRVSGYDLSMLLPENGFNVAAALVGTEATCVTILDATLKLIRYPKERTLVVLGYPDICIATKHVPEILKHEPVGLEGIDSELPKYMKLNNVHTKFLHLLPEGSGWLLVEFGADTKEDVKQKAQNFIDEVKRHDPSPDVRWYHDEEEQLGLWAIRESGLGATVFDSKKNFTWPGWEDSAVPPEKVSDYLKELRQLFKKYNYEASLYGHFGQGCVHCSINFDMQTEEGVQKYQKFSIEAAKLVASYGGCSSGEHGDGQSKGPLLEIIYGKELVQAFREFKYIWDPQGKMNPGKVIDSYGQLTDLKLAGDYPHNEPQTHFHFPDDKGKFSNAVLRCFGVGKCRQDFKGTMCPSYMVTKEEKHTTRGRARMLFEMLQGDVINGWKSKEVKESLELCLSCKGCKGDCPVKVDMATYKAEFLSHYYEGRLRPRSAYVFGWIYWWARIASVLPGVANFFTRTPVISNLIKGLGGIAQKRKMPKFASYTFRDWFFNRKKKSKTGKQKVILWADTFNNFFTPETLVAGVEVLEAAGYEVLVPKKMLCCGRPLYDYGMLSTAKRLLIEIMDALEEEGMRDIPVVGLEPSCVAVFRDELTNLFPRDDIAKKLKEQTFTLAEFLEKKTSHFHVPTLNRKVLFHGHCHHRAIMKMDAEEEVLKKMKVELKMPESGCCGMAGGFGYETGEHYEVSVKAGERVLLPAVREAERSTIILADGFSCREQIEQETDRKGMHLAQVLQMALQQNDADEFKDEPPEQRFVDARKLKDPHRKRNITLMLLALSVGIAAGVLVKSKK